MPKILVIDDDRSILHFVRRVFEDAVFDVLSESDADLGLASAKTHQPDVVLLDVILQWTTGLELFRNFQSIDSKLPVIFITASDNSETAIEAMTLGAYDFLMKPLNLTQVRSRVMQALETRRFMHVPVRVPEAGHEEDHDGDLLIGRSPQMIEVYKIIGRIAPQNVAVLIRGESGTGKELIARAIYQHSHRTQAPFQAVNCAALSESLLESELFGHEKGRVHRRG